LFPSATDESARAVLGSARTQELGKLPFSLDLTVHAVAAHEQPVTAPEIHEQRIDRERVAQTDGVREPRAARHGAAGRRPQVRVHRMILGELEHGARPREIHATVAGVRDERMIAREPYEVERRAHTAVGWIAGGVVAHVAVGLFEGAAKRREDRPARVEVGATDVGFDDALGLAAPEYPANGLNREPCGNLAGLMAPHAVGDGEHGYFRSEERRVFVRGPARTLVSGDREVGTKVEAREDLRRHSPRA